MLHLKFEGIAKSILFNSILNFAILLVLIYEMKFFATD